MPYFLQDIQKRVSKNMSWICKICVKKVLSCAFNCMPTPTFQEAKYPFSHVFACGCISVLLWHSIGSGHHWGWHKNFIFTFCALFSDAQQVHPGRAAVFFIIRWWEIILLNRSQPWGLSSLSILAGISSSGRKYKLGYELDIICQGVAPSHQCFCTVHKTQQTVKNIFPIQSIQVLFFHSLPFPSRAAITSEVFCMLCSFI